MDGKFCPFDPMRFGWPSRRRWQRRTWQRRLTNPHCPDRSSLNVTGIAENARYSQAFERLVQGDDDLTGLLAYALYKKAIREAAEQGRPVYRSEHRSPVGTEVAAYRNAADNKLTVFASSILEQSRADIVNTAIRSDIAEVAGRLQTEIRQAASWRSAILTNLVAWLLSIAVTFLIVAAGVPGWIIALIAKLKGN
jgi:hypothetical protein